MLPTQDKNTINRVRLITLFSIKELQMILIRKIENDELYKIKEIDRSEEIFEMYKHSGVDLKLISHAENVSGFDELELTEIITRQLKLAKRGGLVVGAFDEAKIVGIASVEKLKRGAQQNYCESFQAHALSQFVFHTHLHDELLKLILPHILK